VEIALLAVGKLRPSLREACDDYLRRLSRYVRVREVEVREAARAPTLAAQRRQEAARLRERAPAGADIVVLAREGRSLTSDALARQMERWQLAGRPLVLLLGGSRGLDPELMAEAEMRWSLGPLTLPHELARLVVLEQVYRAFTILRGEPYHKGAR
jgi:23S rRNA (pseudouridine1915-N3)-methyltransferase